MTGRDYGAERDEALTRKVGPDWQRTAPAVAYAYAPRTWASPLLASELSARARGRLVDLGSDLLHRDAAKQSARAL